MCEITPQQFLIEKWNSCIWMNHEDHPGNIVMIYDKHFIRQKKLNSLFDEEEIVFNKTTDSKILFYQDYKNGYLDVSYNEIWSILESKYSLKYDDIQLLIKEVLLEDNKLKQLTPINNHLQTSFTLLEDNKLKQLTPNLNQCRNRAMLLEDNKLKQLTPFTPIIKVQDQLLEDNKLKQLK